MDAAGMLALKIVKSENKGKLKINIGNLMKKSLEVYS